MKTIKKLIDKGRKPFGKSLRLLEDDDKGFLWFESEDGVYIDYSIRDIVSIESGFWQFVCGLENNYLPFCSKCNIRIESNNDKIKSETYYEEEYQYRLMLSSIQEDIEKFILDNVKIDD